MSAFHGGRVECHIRRTSVPVTYLDFRALYPTVSILLDLQAFLTCARVGVREVGATAVEAWLTRCDLRSALQPKTWARLGGIALVQPAGDILPVSADWRHDGSNGIALNIVERATEPLWYALPDLLASRLLTGHAPKVLRVLRFVPKGLQDGLKTVHLGGRVRVDPLGGNLYRALIEGRASVESGDDLLPDERRRLDRFLKNVANSLYGITAEVDPDDAVPAGAEVTAYGLRTFRTSLTRPEKPGRFFFAPQAALTTAGGRLMMAILERLVSDRGGTWATADTDSMSIVSSPEGGPVSCRTPDRTDSIRALSWIEVEAVRETLNTLNPYDRSKVPHLLKLEDVNFEGKDPLLPRQALSAYAVASKKYALSAGAAAGAEIVWPATTGLDSATDEAEIVDRREHGLGHVRDPLGNHNVAQKPDWITQAWAWTLAHEAGQRLTTPDWFGLPLITANATVTTPAVARALNARRRTYRDAIKPFNFLDRPIVDQHELSDAMRGLHLLAPFVADPARWLTRTYVDPGCPGQRFPITVEPTDPEVGADGSGAVKVRTYGELVSDLPTHVEAASDGPDGRPCGPATVGLLSRRRVAIVDVRHRLRETRLIPEPGDATHGTVAQVTFLDEPERHEWARQVLPIIRSFPRARVLAHTEISATTLARIIRSGQAGDARYVEALSAAAARLAGEQLPAWGIKAPAERRARLVTFLAELAMRNPASFAEAHGAPRTCRLCGRELSGRQRGLCVACSKLPGRSRRAAPAAEPQAVK